MPLMPFRIRKTSKGTRNKILTGTYFHVKLQCSQQSSPKRRKKSQKYSKFNLILINVFLCVLNINLTMKTIPPMMMKRKARLNMTSKIFSNLKKSKPQILQSESDTARMRSK